MGKNKHWHEIACKTCGTFSVTAPKSKKLGIAVCRKKSKQEDCPISYNNLNKNNIMNKLVLISFTLASFLLQSCTKTSTVTKTSQIREPEEIIIEIEADEIVIEKPLEAFQVRENNKKVLDNSI